MTYGTLEYWERSAKQSQQECANQRREIEQLWGRLNELGEIIRFAGLDVDDASFVWHIDELAAQTIAGGMSVDRLEKFRVSLVQDVFGVEDAVKQRGMDKAEAFDWLVKRLYARNRTAMAGGDEQAIARSQVADQRAQSRSKRGAA